jgi:cell wall-associated NlpC family hydrolase
VPDGLKPFPLPFTPQAAASLGNQFMGRPYGWGGAWLERDCSLMLQDLFTPFGIWLPRNSSAQLKVGRKADLSNMSAGAKAAWVAENGVPFRTILGMPGHVTLYVGQYNGESVIFHAIWGLRTMTPRGEGRAVLGKVCVTSLSPGKELHNIIPEKMLLHRFTTAATLLVGGGY